MGRQIKTSREKETYTSLFDRTKIPGGSLWQNYGFVKQLILR